MTFSEAVLHILPNIPLAAR